MSFFKSANVKNFFSKAVSDVEIICSEGEAKLEHELQGLKQDYANFLAAVKTRRAFIKTKISSLLTVSGNDITPKEPAIMPTVEGTSTMKTKMK